jgi:hypothetical protein
MIAKRVDYRMRQMEKEFEAREKFLKNEKPASVVAAEKAITAIKETEDWETEARSRQMRGGSAPSMIGISDEGKAMIAERASDRESIIDRLREVEMQVRGAKAIAEETREAILRGDQVRSERSIAMLLLVTILTSVALYPFTVCKLQQRHSQGGRQESRYSPCYWRGRRGKD